mgnify:CR=1 FL=1
MYGTPEGSCAPVIFINSVLSGVTPTNFGVTPAREVSPPIDFCCLVVAIVTTVPASPARAVRPAAGRGRGAGESRGHEAAGLTG